MPKSVTYVVGICVTHVPESTIVFGIVCFWRYWSEVHRKCRRRSRGFIPPRTLPIRRTAVALQAMSGQQRRACTVHQQSAQVHVALFGDAAEATALTAGVLARCQSQPEGKASCAGEAPDVPYARSQSRASQRADTWDLTVCRGRRPMGYFAVTRQYS